MTIWKYEIKPEDEIRLSMPQGAKILSFQTQYGKPCLWALVDQDAKIEYRTFRCIGTGHPIEDPAALRFIGTAQLFDGAILLHLFEVIA